MTGIPGQEKLARLLSRTKSYLAPVMTRPGRNPLWIAFASGGLIVVLSLVTSLVSVQVIYTSAEYPFVGPNMSNLIGNWGFLTGIFIGAAFSVFLVYFRVFGADLEMSLKTARPKRGIVPAILLFVIPILVVIALQLYMDWAGPDDQLFSIFKFLEFLGKTVSNSLLSFFLGVLAIVGFYMSLRQVHDFHNRIFGFAQLTDRVFELSNNSSVDDKLHVISYTPAVGFLALHKNWMRMRDALLREDENGQNMVRILTQKSTSLRQWHGNFLGRKPRRFGGQLITDDNITEATKASKEIKDKLGSDYLEVSYNTLPGYYCFFNSHAAIIVTPLFLPLNSQPRSQDADIKRKQEAIIAGLDPPNMIGFSTNDPIIIENLMDQFEYITKLNNASAGA